MKKLSILQSWTKVLFVFSVILAFFVPGVILLYMINPEIVPFDVSVNGDDKISIGESIVIFAVFAGFCLYIYALYLFRKVLELFSKRKVFHDDVVVNFRKIGKYTWYGLLLTVIPRIIYNLLQYPARLTVSAESLSYILFTGSLALFFMVLSEVFLMAKGIKEENDLTV